MKAEAARGVFIAAYCAAFLGGYAALKYEEDCQQGWTRHWQPVEDAERLAEEAWEQLREVLSR